MTSTLTARPPVTSQSPPPRGPTVTGGRVVRSPSSPCWPAPPWLYLWSLSASGYGNSFYAAAVQAGSQSWKAFFFGSLDAGNAITVDKPPASLWLMALSVRVFGLSSLERPRAPGPARGGHGRGHVRLGTPDVRAVGLLARRTEGVADGHVAGLVAGALLALTPARR